jgi:hypothetical protein
MDGALFHAWANRYVGLSQKTDYMCVIGNPDRVKQLVGPAIVLNERILQPLSISVR